MNSDNLRMRNYCTALVNLYGEDKVREMAERGDHDPTSLTDDEMRAVSALAWLNTHKENH